MNERNQYLMVGRYSKGNEITAYALTNMADGTASKYSKEQVVLLVGRGQVDKIDGQVYKDDVLLRGMDGFSINKLPVKEDTEAKADGVSTDAEPNPNTYFDVPPILTLEAVAKNGRKVIAYLVYNKLKDTSKALSREKVIKLASEKKISNAFTQKDSRSEGGLLLRGLGCNLSELRVMTPEEMNDNGIKIKKKAPVNVAEPVNGSKDSKSKEENNNSQIDSVETMIDTIKELKALIPNFKSTHFTRHKRVVLKVAKLVDTWYNNLVESYNLGDVCSGLSIKDTSTSKESSLTFEYYYSSKEETSKVQLVAKFKTFKVEIASKIITPTNEIKTPEQSFSNSEEDWANGKLIIIHELDCVLAELGTSVKK